MHEPKEPSGDRYDPTQDPDADPDMIQPPDRLTPQPSQAEGEDDESPSERGG
ncbi:MULTISPECIES: hypothetical protein [Nocardia]|uniref:Pp24 protein n=2 Tax=Nocardia TaxID=1817 RepID=A0A4R6P7F3_NOCIG|nr:MULTISPECIES: hypothetical protein [Nocardia]NKX86398.1 hypothetical protein [Nocardia coubleae]TDP33060.1 hypothetical protein DFR75_105298 [Nocardia ignorata]